MRHMLIERHFSSPPNPDGRISFILALSFLQSHFASDLFKNMKNMTKCMTLIWKAKCPPC